MSASSHPRSHFLRRLSVGACLALTAAACGKSEGPKPPAAGENDRSVKIEANSAAAAEGFCDKSWPGEGDKVQPFGAGPKVKGPAAEAKPGQWRWVNYWATWCAPCLEEMPLLGRWRDTFVREGVPFELELWSVDEDEAKLRERVRQGLPAKMVWVDGPESLAAYLGQIGLDPDSMLPVQMLVDPNGNLRCVRVGSVTDKDWGTVRKLVGR